MHIEIEAKLKVDSLDAVAARVAQSGATFVREQTETDTYFDDAQGNLKKADKAFRLRCVQSPEGEKLLLTFKGPKAQGHFKRRQEVEVEVCGRDAAEELLIGLGYEKAVRFQKFRRIWQMGDCLVCLDHLPVIGDFVEIEGPDDKQIAEVQQKLGLAELKHIPHSYSSLMRKELRRLGRTDKDIPL